MQAIVARAFAQLGIASDDDQQCVMLNDPLLRFAQSNTRALGLLPCMEAVAQTPSDSSTTQRWEKILAIQLHV
jgi:hypothetical protein